MQAVSSSTEKDVERKSFPLVLAWSFTYWKAQGMTLRRARVCLTKKSAAISGIGLVACSRVRHLRDIVFDRLARLGGLSASEGVCAVSLTTAVVLAA